jgi:Xaa-Pro aminopeptidase
MALTQQERAALREAAVHKGIAVEEAIERLRRHHPEAFHTEDSLATRIFYHRPLRNEPHRSFVAANSPARP